MQNHSFWDVAHRGGEGYAPENTLASFERTMEYGIGWIEVDLRMSRDGHLVLLHDQTVDRTTDGQGAVVDIGLDELKRLDAGSWFDAEFSNEQIPTLAELFDVCGARVNYLLDVRGPDVVEQLVEVVQDCGRSEQVYAIGRNSESLALVKQLAPEIGVGLTCLEPSQENIERALELGAHHIIIWNELLTPDMIASCASRGLFVLSTTVRTREQLERAVACGVVGMPLPDPRTLHEYLAEVQH